MPGMRELNGDRTLRGFREHHIDSAALLTGRVMTLTATESRFGSAASTSPRRKSPSERREAGRSLTRALQSLSASFSPDIGDRGRDAPGNASDELEIRRAPGRRPGALANENAAELPGISTTLPARGLTPVAASSEQFGAAT
jgi:hypothetical protein